MPRPPVGAGTNTQFMFNFILLIYIIIKGSQRTRSIIVQLNELPIACVCGEFELSSMYIGKILKSQQVKQGRSHRPSFGGRIQENP